MVGTTDVQSASNGSVSNGSASNGTASNGSAVTNRNHNGSTVDDKNAALDKIRLNPHVNIVIINSFNPEKSCILFIFVCHVFYFCPHQKHQKSEYKTTWDDLLWGNIIYLGYLHLGAVYGLYLLLTGNCKISTVLLSETFLYKILSIKYFKILC